MVPICTECDIQGWLVGAALGPCAAPGCFPRPLGCIAWSRRDLQGAGSLCFGALQLALGEETAAELQGTAPPAGLPCGVTWLQLAPTSELELRNQALQRNNSKTFLESCIK